VCHSWLNSTVSLTYRMTREVDGHSDHYTQGPPTTTGGHHRWCENIWYRFCELTLYHTGKKLSIVYFACWKVAIGKTKNTYAIFRSCIMRYSVKMKHKQKLYYALFRENEAQNKISTELMQNVSNLLNPAWEKGRGERERNKLHQIRYLSQLGIF